MVLLTQLQGCENSGEFSLHKRSPFCGIMMWNHIFTVWHGYTRLHGSRAAARWSRYKSYQVQLTDEQTQGKPHAQAGENINIWLGKQLSALNDEAGGCLKVRQTKEMLTDLLCFIKLLKKPEVRTLGL